MPGSAQTLRDGAGGLPNQGSVSNSSARSSWFHGPDAAPRQSWWWIGWPDVADDGFELCVHEIDVREDELDEGFEFGSLSSAAAGFLP